jgi:lysophospholipase L1-like esterase
VFNAPRGRASFDVVVGAAPPLRVRIDGDSVSPEQVRIRRSGLLALPFDTDAPNNSMQLQNFVGDPEFYGVFVEGNGPGVVIDTYGINGARIRTPLSWVSEAFVGELAEREPELVVLAYGTNEAGDNAPAESYRSYYEQVLQRVRAGAPEADCLLVGPTDRQNSEGLPMRRVADLDAFQRSMAADAGCAYFSLFTTMGGSGGFANWVRGRPQLAASDGVHLTISGYQRLGEEMTDALLLGWDSAAEGASAEL